MSAGQAGIVTRFLHKLRVAEQARTLPDGELLSRFVGQGDQAAFGTLVQRHGPMVLRLCRRVLHHEQDAEDAFQATFLVLSGKARGLRSQEAVGSWLYRVAYRLACKVKTSAARRRAREGHASPGPATDPLTEITVREGQAILDQELAHLPEKYRAPLVLCCLEGMARDEAAQQLGVPLSTLKSRLEQARERLRARLSARGVALTGAWTALFFCERAASGSVPTLLLQATVQAATAFAAGGATTAFVSGKVAALTEGVLKTMLLTKLTMATAALLAVGVLAAGTGGLLYQVQVTGRQEASTAGGPEAAAKPQRAPAAPHAEVARVLDQFQALLPHAEDLALFQLDWVPTLQEAKHKAAQGRRPVLLMVVTNSYGNLHSGHC